MPMPIANSDAQRDALRARSDSGTPPAGSHRLLATLWRRALVGSTSGLVAGIALAVGLHNIALGLLLGVLVGGVYALVSRSIATRSVENVFTAAALGFPLWTVLTTILIPVMSGHGPQWSADDMRMLLPGLVGWIVYGAMLGVLIPAVSAAVIVFAGPEPLPITFDTKPPLRIVILGGGFAGMTTAKHLERQFGADLRVSFTLISEGNALLFTPMLAEVAGSSLEPSHISSPLRTSLHRTQVLRARVTGVDFDQRFVLADSGESAQPLKIPYDHLVFALGSNANYFGNENVRNNSFDFKGLLDAIRIRNHVIEMFELADAEEDEVARREMLTFIIAGGGFAGVELAGALNDFARGILADYPRLRSHDVQVTVVHPRDVILPELSKSLADYARRHMELRGVHFELGRRVLDAGPGRVTLDTREIRARTLVWTAGTLPSPLLRKVGLETENRGAVIVDNTLAVAGRLGVWALGDCAAVIDAKTGKPYGPTAQVASRQARVLARNIKADIEAQRARMRSTKQDKSSLTLWVERLTPRLFCASAREPRKLRPFHFNSLGALCVVGHHTACAEFNLPRPIGKSVRFSGLLAWLMWRGIYVSKLPGLERKVRVLLDWTVELFFPRDIVQTIDLK